MKQRSEDNFILSPTTVDQSSQVSQRRDYFSLILFCALTALNCLWVLSLPAFPSQDGPVHLYYVSVIHHLLEHSQLFSEYFSLRHPIPPYSFQYLLLFLLTNVFGYLLAEKIVVCFFVVVFCFGFRFLVTSVNARSHVLAYCGIPLSLNWMLGMGFLNYCISLAFSLFAVGLWIRFSRRQSLALAAAFVGTIVLILFTHPIPLLIVLAFIWSQIALSFVQPYLSRRGEQSLAGLFSGCLRQIMLAAVSTCSLGYILLFVSTKKTGENLHHPFIQRGMIKDYFLLHPLVLTFGTFGARVYRFCLYAMILTAFLMAFKGVRRRLRERSLQASDLLILGSGFLAIIYPFFPRSINGSDFFADRLVLYIWLFALAGAALDFTADIRREYLWAGALTLVTILSIVVDNGQIRPTANVLMQIENDKLNPPGTKGVFIYAPVQPLERPITFDPYLWSATRYFRRANIVMLNAPWLDLPILPVGPAEKLFTNLFPARILNYPDRFVTQILKFQDIRDLIIPKMDFLIFIGYTDRDPTVVDNVLKRTWAHPWNCNRTGWYSVCSD